MQAVDFGSGANLQLDRAVSGRARAGHLPLRPDAGVWLANAPSGFLGTGAQVVDAERVAPFFCAWDLTIDQVALNVATLAAAQNCKVTCYESDVAGKPAVRLFESPNLSMAATVTVTVALAAPIVLLAGRKYWLGVRSSGTPTLRSLAAQSAQVLTWTTANPPVSQFVLERTLAYATPATDWVYSNAQISGSLPPLVLLRTA